MNGKYYIYSKTSYDRSKIFGHIGMYVPQLID